MRAKYQIDGETKTLSFDFGSGNPMSRNGFSVSLMEKVFQLILAQGGASTNVYTNRPKALAVKVEDFIVSSMQGSLEDFATYGECVMNIALFAKDVSEFKNGMKLSSMQSAVFAGLPFRVSVTDENDVAVVEYLIDQTPDIMGDTPDDYGFHCRMILLKTTIKVI